MHLKAGYQVTFGGSARTLSQAGNDFAIAIILAVAFIYMVLASQFNSFIHPLTIMTALPLSLPAGLLALMAFGMTINVYSVIGLMMLFGIVKKNSILRWTTPTRCVRKVSTATPRSSGPATSGSGRF
jgi:HAE1 family hydrophobic/amphiphilic exporter-1